MVYGNSNANEEFLRLTYQADMRLRIAAYLDRHAAVAQLEERQVSTLQVAGLIPVRRSKILCWLCSSASILLHVAWWRIRRWLRLDGNDDSQNVEFS